MLLLLLIIILYYYYDILYALFDDDTAGRERKTYQRWMIWTTKRQVISYNGSRVTSLGEAAQSSSVGLLWNCSFSLASMTVTGLPAHVEAVWTPLLAHQHVKSWQVAGGAKSLIWYWNARPTRSMVPLPASPNCMSLFIFTRAIPKGITFRLRLYAFRLYIMCVFCIVFNLCETWTCEQKPAMTPCGWRGYKPSVNK